MKPPSFLSQIAGTPFVALLLSGVYTSIFLGYSQGHVPLWVTVITGMFALSTGNAVIEVRHYQRLMTVWESTGNGNSGARRRKPSWLSMLLAAALLGFLPTRHVPNYSVVMNAYLFTWALSALYLLFAFLKLVWMMRGRRAKEPKTKQANVTTPQTECLIARPGTSPSVDEATRNLPDYAAAMLRARPNDRL